MQPGSTHVDIQEVHNTQEVTATCVDHDHPGTIQQGTGMKPVISCRIHEQRVCIMQMSHGTVLVDIETVLVPVGAAAA